MNKQPSSAIVVGGGSGIGRATVLALAAAGTRVWAVGRDRARLEQVRREAVGPGEVTVRAFDATDGPAMDRLIAEVDPDLLVLSAGARARLALIPEQTWESSRPPGTPTSRSRFRLGRRRFAGRCGPAAW